MFIVTLKHADGTLADLFGVDCEATLAEVLAQRFGLETTTACDILAGMISPEQMAPGSEQFITLTLATIPNQV